MKHLGYLKLSDRDYREISDRFHKRKEWHEKEPLLFDEMSLAFKEKWPCLKDYCIYNLPQSSEKTKHYLLGHDSYKCEEHEDKKFEGETVKDPPSDETVKGEHKSDEEIPENLSFRYPLVRKNPSPDEHQKCERVTIVLHGLNEFSYHKYIPWACQIAWGTKMPVVLFPLTFSITRASREWASPSLKGEILTQRKGVENSGFFNAIISERLGARPERFFWGAVQSYWDIVNFVSQIRDNHHDHIAPDARVDFLGFSSGGYLALTLLLADSEGWFSRSRACLFASCVEMRSLGPGSPYIIDRATETKLKNFYVDNIDTAPNERMKHWFDLHPEGQWLRSFGGLSPVRRQREVRLQEIARRVLAVANINDRVMPPGAMLDALQGDARNPGVRFVRLDLGIHENPFVCPDYKPDRRYLVRFIDEQRYGGEFEKFVNSVTEHLNQDLED